MKLVSFSKNKKQKKIIISSILGILVFIGSITLYKTFALYKEEKTFNVIRGRVPNFSISDIQLAVKVDGIVQNEIPKKDSASYEVDVICNNDATATWNYEDWGVDIRNISNPKVNCNAHFKTLINFSDYIISMSESKNDIVKFTHVATEQTPALTDYRYTGANPSNYVYFGCEGDSCTEDNLYRIIGVIPTQSEIGGEYENRIKLIKDNYYTEEESGYLEQDNNLCRAGSTCYGYKWFPHPSVALNNWEESTVNTKVLNEIYWTSLGEYQKYIMPTVWHLGAPTGDYPTHTPDNYYLAERSNAQSYNKGVLSLATNIGLMYPSDYGYSLGEEYRSKSVYTERSQYQTNSWLYNLENKYYEWTITPETAYEGIVAYAISSDGSLANDYVPRIYALRPTFYLSADVLVYSMNNGSREDPYHLKVN